MHYVAVGISTCIALAVHSVLCLCIHRVYKHTHPHTICGQRTDGAKVDNAESALPRRKKDRKPGLKLKRVLWQCEVRERSASKLMVMMVATLTFAQGSLWRNFEKILESKIKSKISRGTHHSDLNTRTKTTTFIKPVCWLWLSIALDFRLALVCFGSVPKQNASAC